MTIHARERRLHLAHGERPCTEPRSWRWRGSTSRRTGTPLSIASIVPPASYRSSDSVRNRPVAWPPRAGWWIPISTSPATFGESAPRLRTRPNVVLDLARLAAMSGFDAAHPLWEFTACRRPEGGRSALVMKLHHSLTDGIGGMQLLLTLFDTASEAPRSGCRSLIFPPDCAQRAAELLTASLLHGGRQLLEFTRHQAHWRPPLGAAERPAPRAERHEMSSRRLVPSDAQSPRSPTRSLRS